MYKACLKLLDPLLVMRLIEAVNLPEEYTLGSTPAKETSFLEWLNGEWATQRFDQYQHIYQYSGIPFYNMFPFRTIYHYLTHRDQYNFDIWFNNTFGNVFLFIPLGMLLPILFRSCQSKVNALGISTAIAVVIELISNSLHSQGLRILIQSFCVLWDPLLV
jgi:hypothetical protein